MRRRLALLLMAAVVGCEAQQRELPEVRPEALRAEAEGFATAFLEQLDAGEIAETWPLVAHNVQERADEATWTKVLGESREALGALRERALREYEYSEDVPEAPPGSYFVFDFESVFEAGDAVERVVCFLEGGERWRVAGYFTTKK
jgi:hypothetical protein